MLADIRRRRGVVRWNRKREMAELPELIDVSIVTDEQLEQLASTSVAAAKAAFRLSEAEGAGDYELTQGAINEPVEGYIDSYDVAFPEWSPEYLKKVQDNVGEITVDDFEELTRDLQSSPSEQIRAVHQEGERLKKRLAELTQTLVGDGSSANSPTASD